MNDIIAMARRAGAHDDGFEVRFVELRYLERFAALVRADEREACAKVCDELETCSDAEFYGHEFSAAIRARSKDEK